MNLLSKSNKINRIHFVGIGGISMSALAMLAKSKNYIVTGTDDNDSQQIQKLKRCGIEIEEKHTSNFVKLADLVVYTIAVKSHPDLILAKALSKKIIERAEFLGHITKHYSHTIAISGTHGKTTITALLGHIFEIAKQKPTVHIGGVSQNWGSNLLIGGDEYFITEACEFNRSFLHLSPECTCITNIECDHMDTYKDFADIQSTFIKFVNKTKKIIVFCGDDVKIPLKKSKSFLSYGFDAKNRFSARNIHYKNLCVQFDCYLDGKFYLRAKMKICGKHNILNALACIAICYAYNIPYIYIIEGIQSFLGVERRQTLLGEVRGVIHYADYAHHPTEIKALCESIAQIPHTGKELIIFQPHTYTRTISLFSEFIKVLSNCKNLILLPTYGARENPIAGGDSTDLFLALPPNGNRVFCSNYLNLCQTLSQTLKSGDICVWLGAGDIYEIAKKYVSDGQNKKDA